MYFYADGGRGRLGGEMRLEGVWALFMGIEKGGGCEKGRVGDGGGRDKRAGGGGCIYSFANEDSVGLGFAMEMGDI